MSDSGSFSDGDDWIPCKSNKSAEEFAIDWAMLKAILLKKSPSAVRDCIKRGANINQRWYYGEDAEEEKSSESLVDVARKEGLNEIVAILQANVNK